MSDFLEMMRQNRLHHSQIKKLCEPLFHHFGFKGLFYQFIGNDSYGTGFSHPLPIDWPQKTSTWLASRMSFSISINGL